MALEFIAFSNGSATDILSGDEQLSYDPSALNISLGHTGLPTISGIRNILASGEANNILAGTRTGIYSGYGNTINNADVTGVSAIFNAYQSTITAGNINTILSGLQNQITSTGQSNTLIGGATNIIQDSAAQGSILGSVSSLISGTTTTSAIIGGDSNLIQNATRSSILGGSLNQVIGTNRSAVVTGESNIINGATSNANAILTGNSNVISSTGGHNAIVNGVGNVISGTASNSVALGSFATVSASNSLNMTDGVIGASTLSTANAVGLYMTNGVVVADTASVQPLASSIFTVDSVVKGWRGPVMTTAQRLAISSPAVGLEVFDLTLDEKFIYTSGGWVSLTDPLPFDYQTDTVSIDFTGPWASTQTANVYCERIGTTVTLRFPLISQPNSVSSLISISALTTPLPGWTTPTDEMYLPFIVINNDGFLCGSILLLTNGGATIGKYEVAPINHVTPISAIDLGGASGFIQNSITYSVA